MRSRKQRTKHQAQPNSAVALFAFTVGAGSRSQIEEWPSIVTAAHDLGCAGHWSDGVLDFAAGKEVVEIRTPLDDVADQVLAYITRVMPNLPDLIIGRHVLSPVDLETIYGLTQGDIFHGRHDLDQIYSLRPHPDAAQYRTPIQGLYLCGSGAHPGGGVSGMPGHNAARRVLADFKSRKL